MQSAENGQVFVLAQKPGRRVPVSLRFRPMDLQSRHVLPDAAVGLAPCGAVFCKSGPGENSGAGRICRVYLA